MFSFESKILIADDMMTMRRIVKKSLMAIGFTHIQDAKNGQEAWEHLQNGDYDIIISDWNMPELSGLGLLKKVRADSKYAKIPFLLLTAEADDSQMKEANEAGVDTYVIKPFSVEVLKTKLEETFANVSERLAS